MISLRLRRAAAPAVAALLSVAVLALAACQATPAATTSAAGTESSPPSASVSPSGDGSAPSPSGEGFAGPVDIGGRSLYLECRGGGEPTILFLHGDGGTRTHGYPLFDAYADRHQVCVYDRANMGLSDPVEAPQSGADVVGDLKALLTAAALPGPYLIVAGSFGGLVAELYAADQPDQVAGIVFIDASLHSDADVDRYFAEQGELDLEAFEAEYAGGPETILWTIHDEARATLDKIPDVPITYLRASESRGGLPPDAQAIWDAGLDEVFAQSSNSRLVEVTGPHALPPAPVHEAIDQMLEDLGGA